MANADPNRSLFPQQPEVLSNTSQQSHIDDVLMILNIVERLPVFSSVILEAANEGEPNETLAERLKTLHLNLHALSALAKKAKLTDLEGTGPDQ